MNLSDQISPFHSFIHCNHVNYSYILPHHHHHVCHLSCVPTLLWTYECVGYFWRLKWFNSIHSRCHLINMENGKSKSEVGLTHTRRRRKCPFMIRQIVGTFRGRISDSIIIILTRSNVTKFDIIDHKLSPVLSDHTLVLSAYCISPFGTPHSVIKILSFDIAWPLHHQRYRHQIYLVWVRYSIRHRWVC